ncbi:MAG TPA: hypothetical protein VM287_11215 [Egibacteraceae bacterium]|nr:hypothetical protein [Egibacteraceae bacterium]
MFTAPSRPVSRFRMLLGTLALLGALAGVVGLSELLRHPHGDVGTAIPAAEGDFRDEIVCPDHPAPEEEVDGERATGPAVPVSSVDLYDCPTLYDGLLVHYQGEVVGALMHRDEGAWTQLNDDLYAGAAGPLPAHREYRGANAGVGVLLPADVAEQVQTVGGPRARGDVLSIVGTFHRVDPQSRESAVIRAEAGRVERLGRPIDHEPLGVRRIVGILLALAAAAMTAAHHISIRREPLREIPKPAASP